MTYLEHTVFFNTSGFGPPATGKKYSAKERPGMQLRTANGPGRRASCYLRPASRQLWSLSVIETLDIEFPIAE